MDNNKMRCFIGKSGLLRSLGGSKEEVIDLYKKEVEKLETTSIKNSNIRFNLYMDYMKYLNSNFNRAVVYTSSNANNTVRIKINCVFKAVHSYFKNQKKTNSLANIEKYILDMLLENDESSRAIEDAIIDTFSDALGDKFNDTFSWSIV